MIQVSQKGYGSALRHGIEHCNGKYIIMGDADDSYNFLELSLFIERLQAGYDMVMGNRFAGGITKGAMPWLHRYVGNPFLSSLGRFLFKNNIGDFHCGLRAFTKNAITLLTRSVMVWSLLLSLLPWLLFIRCVFVKSR